MVIAVVAGMMLLTSPGVWAQQLPVQIDVDVSTFSYDASNSLVEIYLAVEAASMSFTSVENGFRSELPIDLAIVRSTEQGLDTPASGPVWADSVYLTFVIPDTASLTPGQHFLHQVRTAVPPGEYQLDVVVPSFAASDGAAISDLTLATNIQPSDDKESPFYKNGLIVRPNANQLYGQGLTQLFFYAETYNVRAIPGIGEDYTIFSYVAEANVPSPLPGYSRRFERPVRSPDVVVGAFDLKELPSGSYFLRFVILNDENESVAEQSRKFFVYNPVVKRDEPVAVQTPFESSVFATLSEEDIEREMELIELVASDSERTRAKRIRDLDEKRRFLMSFWQVRDANPNTPGNAFRDEFYQRLQYANERYTASYAEGWKTDRGRVLLKHGLPSAIDPHLYERDSVPYEVWEYNNIPGEGQAVFVFADRSGFGQFDLIHSTVTGETTLPDWRDALRRR